ncbi:Protein translocase subunit SecA, chloroplastic [Ananas comosus]|uniref:Protein translocase subunit SecA, chloroplastic n=1 Tax=Ananas comosus TaxID=4615 RepID=A0A199UEX6_ANACO|nr:Protein translocase subunit SecA, chloroplastic [Ananas comosus]
MGFAYSAFNMRIHYLTVNIILAGDRRETSAGTDEEAERFLILSNIDRLWKEHLQALKFVQQAVGLRGYAQRDPLIEYDGSNPKNVIYSVYQVVFLTYAFQPMMVKKQEEGDDSQKKEPKGEAADSDANPIGAAQTA